MMMDGWMDDGMDWLYSVFCIFLSCIIVLYPSCPGICRDWDWVVFLVSFCTILLSLSVLHALVRSCLFSFHSYLPTSYLGSHSSWLKDYLVRFYFCWRAVLIDEMGLPGLD